MFYWDEPRFMGLDLPAFVERVDQYCSMVLAAPGLIGHKWTDFPGIQLN